ncbi:MAG: bifunctional 4-hydroxy-2-oxoglutarate aldolase/2-dehydro-3-deoxy-phosphogluconate aldolase [Hyphomonadaceae bacterium]|nr:bifunctional 4-hydroxy-2-oxoglutarate aldolase/2-dehydro-3-deoxy-phosphogluconate aldolase [Hyphomonadaceae bacterium]
MSAPLKPEAVLALTPVLPVITIEDASWAAPLARALAAGGVKSAEVTLRTPAALEAIRIMAREAPELIVGAGTVLSESDLMSAAAAGARYALSPGATAALLKAGAHGPIPLIPGIATASELMTGLEQGYTCFKFFPAERLGGPAALKDLGAPLPAARFCPTGGIGIEKIPDYLALKNVLCVGGSWVTPPDKMRSGDWAGIEALARQTASFR